MRRLCIGLLLGLLLACSDTTPEPVRNAPEPREDSDAAVAPIELEPDPLPPVAVIEPIVEPRTIEPIAEPVAAVPTPPPNPRPPRPRPTPPPEKTSAPAPDAEPPPAEVQPSIEPSTPAPEVPPASFEFETLERRLRDTRALGFFTKLELKNQIDDLLNAVRDYHERGVGRIGALRERFDLLVLKVMSLLQEGEPKLAAEIGQARAALWEILASRVRFAELEAS